MKKILMSTHPIWCEKIGNKEKTEELRKIRPEIEPPFKVLIYMTRGNASYPVQIDGHPYICHNNGGQVVVGEFICDRILEYYLPYPAFFCNVSKDVQELVKNACLTLLQAHHYIGTNPGYSFHISELKMYNHKEMKNINDFFKADVLDYDIWLYGIYSGKSGARSNYNSYLNVYRLKRPPQSWCYVKELGDLIK